MLKKYKHLLPPLIKVLPTFVTLTTIFLTIAVSGQQVLRMSANDPQVQFAEEVSSAVSGDVAPEAITGQPRGDATKNLGPFLVIYAEDGKPLSSTADIDGNVPVLAKRTLDSIKKAGQKSFTWEPKKGFRTAAVSKYFKGEKSSGFVVVAKSLREVELRTMKLYLVSLAGYVLTLLSLTILPKFLESISRKFKLQ